MEFYISQTARQYSDLIAESVIATLTRTSSGFIPESFYPNELSSKLENLSICFVTSQDYKSSLQELYNVFCNKNREAELPSDESQALTFPYLVWWLLKNGSASYVTLLNRDGLDLGFLYSSLYDNLGLYRCTASNQGKGVSSANERMEKEIFICVDRILSHPKFRIGELQSLLYVVLLELAHAIMDDEHSLDFKDVLTNLSKNTIVSESSNTMLQAFCYAQENALAGAFAHRALRSSGYCDVYPGIIDVFMNHQPIEFQIGAKIARNATDSTLTSFIRNWTNLKNGSRQLQMSPSEWFDVVAKPNWPQSDSDIKSLIHRL